MTASASSNRADLSLSHERLVFEWAERLVELGDHHEKRRLLETYRQRSPSLAARVEGLVAEGAGSSVSTLDPKHFELRRVDDWIVEARVGSGGEGRVYRVVAAEAAEDAPRYALKVFLDGVRDRGSAMQEEALLGRLTHLGIPRVHASGVAEVEGHPPMPYLVLDFIEGRDLHEGTERPRARPQTLRLLADVARVLQHVHEGGVGHFDVKPANIRVRPDGSPVLLDFGLARDLEADSARGLRGLTAAYASPEQWDVYEWTLDSSSKGRECPTTLTSSVDQFSLAMVGWELLAGEHPFAEELAAVGEDRSARVRKALRERGVPSLADRASEIPAGLAEVFSRALALGVEDRYESLEAFANALERFALCPVIAVNEACVAKAS